MSLTGPAEHDTAVGQPSQSAPVGLSLAAAPGRDHALLALAGALA